MEIPEAFVEWWTRNAPSNTDLATASNVNRKWRTIVMRELLKQVEQVNQKESSSAKCPLLLLPSMLRRTTIAAMTTSDNHDQLCAAPREEETFCAAWFHPAGIQIHPMSSSGRGGDRELEMVAPARGYAQESARSPSPPPSTGRNVKKSPSLLPLQQEEGPLCSNEWRGYRDPMDVLEPFGYAERFVNTVLSRAEEAASILTNGNSRTQHGAARSRHDGENHSNQRTDVKTTIAVRGATLARPEGYCLCWDSSEFGPPAASAKDSGDKAKVPADGFLRSMMDSKRRRQMLQADVLPRVLLSSKHKNPLNIQMENKQQPCLQFLNASGSNAVRLLTPPFECGPIEGPITIFLIGIATEDGCFVSGLKRRCEVGHMHPLNVRDAMIDMSPVCIATDYRQANPPRSDNNSPSESMFASQADRSYCDADSGLDSDDSSCAVETGQDSAMPCKCDFGEAPSQSFHDEEECVWRGQRGPGAWHCYVCVFDKAKSLIRVDGAPELLEQSGCPDPPPGATLDGLTIGSDHCFDMSLCLGDGSIEEGEGAIAELAVFKGRMVDADIDQMECFLMQKHGIVKPTTSDRATLIRQDEWKRQGRALIAQPPPWAMSVSSGIPLPMMARDKDVSWHRMNAVTGKDVRVARIGSKFSNGSSDW